MALSNDADLQLQTLKPKFIFEWSAQTSDFKTLNLFEYLLNSELILSFSSRICCAFGRCLNLLEVIN